MQPVIYASVQSIIYPLAEEDSPVLINITLEEVPKSHHPNYAILPHLCILHIYFPSISIAYAMNALGFLNLTSYQVFHLHLKHHHDYIIIIIT